MTSIIYPMIDIDGWILLVIYLSLINEHAPLTNQTTLLCSVPSPSQATYWPGSKGKLDLRRSRSPIWAWFRTGPTGRMCCSTTCARERARTWTSRICHRYNSSFNPLGHSMSKHERQIFWLLLFSRWHLGNGHLFVRHCEHVAGLGHDEVLEGQAHHLEEAGEWWRKRRRNGVLIKRDGV